MKIERSAAPHEGTAGSFEQRPEKVMVNGLTYGERSARIRVSPWYAEPIGGGGVRVVCPDPLVRYVVEENVMQYTAFTGRAGNCGRGLSIRCRRSACFFRVRGRVFWLWRETLLAVIRGQLQKAHLNIYEGRIPAPQEVQHV